MSRSIDALLTAPLTKVAARRAAEVCARAELSGEGMASLLPHSTPESFLAVLIDARHFADAVRFLAHSMPAREGVWWACVVAGRAPASGEDARCLERVEAWVYHPTEALRRACLPAAEALAFKSAAAFAALAAFWSGDLAPDGSVEVPPPPGLCAIGVGASLLLAGAAGGPARADDAFHDILVRGIDIAGGGNGRRSGDRATISAAGSLA